MTDRRSLPSAYIKHQLPGRVRLKIPYKKGDFGYFERMAETFARCRNLTQLQLNPLAASILICHTPENDFKRIADFAKSQGLFTLASEEDIAPLQIFHPSLAAATALRMSRANGKLRQVSQGRLDGRSLLFFSLVGLAAHQATQGRIMAPAASLLWYALSLLKEENQKTNGLGGIEDFEPE